MKRTWFTNIGENKGSPRLWVEGANRLNSIGFTAGSGLAVEASCDGLGVVVRKVGLMEGSNRVTPRRGSPIIDILSRSKLGALSRYGEVVVKGSFGKILVSPSVRAFNILRSTSETKERFKVLELFAGGGTLGHALAGIESMQVVAANEINPAYADLYCANHPEAEIIEGNVRTIATDEYPDFDILTAGIPCTCHSTMGRTKNKLKGRPETGEQGDLFIPVLSLIQRRMPRAVVLENVPSFGNSLAGELIKEHLKKLGYHLFESVLEPLQWGEIQNRRRWVLVGTLKAGFHFTPEQTGIGNLAGDYLDAPCPEQDKADCERIAKTIEGLRAHNARHAAKGNGFGFTTINAQSPEIKTIARSYAKINTGPFVETEYGLRLLRQSELARIFGCEMKTDSFRIASECYGQGLQTRVFRSVLSQLSHFLKGGSLTPLPLHDPVASIHYDPEPMAALSPVQTTLF